MQATDIALQTNENLSNVPSSLWDTIPHGQFKIADDLWVGKLSGELAQKVLEACEPPGLMRFKPVRQYAQMYAFGRNVGETGELNWDSGNRLYTCIALSRVVQPTTISIAYAARLLESPEGLEIVPAALRGHASAAYVLRSDQRDWLTLNELQQLRSLWSKLQWLELPLRVRGALFLHEEAAGDRWFNLHWQKLFNALHQLLYVREDYRTRERQLVQRGHQLASLLQVSSAADDFEKILQMEQRFMLPMQGKGLTDEDMRLEEVLADTIRKTIERAILDSDFAEIFRNDVLLRTKLNSPPAPVTKAVRGTRDLLPPETVVWNSLESQVREVFALYNFSEIRTPIFEDTQLFARGVGEETDIVSKEMYTWEDRARAQSEKAQSLTLRPENTAGVVRAYIEHKLWERPGLQKLYYIGPQFRRERPQKGRYRQFYQIGAEVIGAPTAGSESPVRDAEVLQMLVMLLNRLEIKDWTLQLNSVGSPSSRPAFDEALRKALSGVVDRMCVDCQRRAVMNPLRVFDCKVPEDQPIIEKLPRITGFLDEADRKHFEQVQEILRATGVPFVINDRLVRGLDYYTRTAFEFTQGNLGAQNAILGGGRYDGLSEALGGPHAPGIGFAIGEDRFVMALAATSGTDVPESVPQAYVAPLGGGMNVAAAKLASELRTAGVRVELGDESFRLKKSFEIAEKLGIENVIIVGEDEAKSGEYSLKNLKSGEQQNIPKSELLQKIAVL